MERHKAVLYIGSGSHLLGAAQKDPHLPGADLGEQFLFPRLCVGFVDKSNLLGGHPLGDELLADVLIDGKGRLRLIQWDCFFQPMKQRIVQLFGCLFGGELPGAWKCHRIPAGSACQPRRLARSA